TETSEIVGSPEFVFARVVDDLNGCFSIGNIRLDYQLAPDIGVDRLVHSTCLDPDFFESNNGIDTVNYENFVTSYDLSILIDELQNTYPNITFRILEFPLGIPPVIVTTAPNRTTFLGVSTGDFCEAIIPFELHKNLLFNVFGEERTIFGCDDASNDGVLDFNLTDIFTELQNDYAIGISFYNNEEDRDNSTNQLDLNSIITVTNTERTLYITSTYNDCVHNSQVNLSINPKPDFTPQITERCGNFNALTNTTQIAINPLVNVALQGIPNFIVEFYISEADAIAQQNEVESNYDVTGNSQLFYTRITNNNTGCFDISTLLINALALPTVNEGQSLIACADNFEFNQTWNLTAIELMVLEGRQFSIRFNYFESEEDLQTDTNEILNPEAYTNTSSPQTVFAKVTNNTTGCFAVAPFNLILNTPPPINDFQTFNVCENDTNSVDLLEVNQVLLENTFNILVSYHNSEANAENNLNALNTNYNYTNTVETVFARVEFSTTGCYAVYPFQLVVNPLPIANQPNDMVACDDDTDGLLEFNLNNQDVAVLGGQNPDDFSVSYFNSEENATNTTNPLTSNYFAFNGEIIFVRLERNSTECFDITQFSIAVNPLPEIDLSDQVICLNSLPLIVSADTGNTTDTYLWSTNATTAQIEITQIGTYSVTVTNALGCQNTSTFNVTESESATIDVVETIDFSDPNNITITVNGIGNYLYQLNSFPFQTSNTFFNVPIGYNTITILDQNGCAQITREVLVIDAPKHMTPNADGDFDTWHIAGVETLPGTTVFIFNRYGKLLKELSHNTPGWDGTYNGNNLPAGDYWYLADIRQNGNSFEVKGHFALRR
ncbi:T9SS type B sorting domain-containing protein, partial [Winogradskyella sp.]|nr:T9SS type B sorting domain-containing protein [Winogradskyella sp.]